MISDLSAAPPDQDETARSASASARVLVVSPFPGLRHSLAALLTEAGYWMNAARSADEAGEQLARDSIDILLVDADDAGDCEMLRAVRRQTDLPILALVASGGADAVVAAFDAGADDCASWPDGPSDSGNVRELTRRIEALLRRRGSRQGGSEVVAGPAGLLLRPRAHEASVAGEDLELTPKEFAVLQLLLEHRGDVLTADRLSEALWGHETFGARNFVEAHISRLRHKLRAAGAPNVITTVRGVGYKIR